MKELNILKLRLRDYRCFEEIDIDFHERLTVLIAANGAGKTSILDAVAVAFGPYLGSFDEGVGKHFLPSDIRLSRVRDTASSEMEYAPKGVRLEATGYIPGSISDVVDLESTWRRSLAGPTKSKTTIKDAKELIDYGKRQQEAVRTPGKEAVLPLLAYYGTGRLCGTGRLWQQKKLMEGKLSRTSRTIGYLDCLDPASSYKSFVAWFRYWNTNALKGLLDASKSGRPYSPTEFDDYITAVSDAVNICLEPAGWKDISYSLAREELVAHHDHYGELPVELLSDGIRNMIGMVADMAFRATKLNPQFGADAAKQTSGVVLIDEVDMHLHPSWQQRVLGQLREAFPKIQFIVTTHSPQVLTSVEASCVRLLKEYTDPETGVRKTFVTPVSLQTKGVASSDVLTQIMGVNPIPPVDEACWFSDYTAKIENGTHEDPDGLSLRQKLVAHFGVQHPLMLDAERLIRFQAFKLRKKSTQQD